jgi:hypothetical protein
MTRGVSELRIVFTQRKIIVLAAAIVFCAAENAPAGAQTVPRGSGWGARVMIQPVVIAHGGFAALCNPRAARLAGSGVDQIEKVVSPSGSQRAALDVLRAEAAKAVDLSAGACPRTLPQNSRERLAFLEQRLSALRHATALVATAFDSFYVSLSDEQKAQVDSGPRRWQWRT